MQLYDYQQDIVDRGRKILSEKGLLYLALEMRCGKTPISLSIAQGYQNVLFVTKKAAISSAVNDFKALGYGYNLVVINYESLHKVDMTPDLVILDEAHSIGAFPKPSLRARQLRAGLGKIPLILLSGTPTPESYSQIFHQLWVSQNHPFGRHKNFYSWAKEFVRVSEKRVGMHVVNDYSNADIQKIQPYLDPYMITFTQAEAGFTSGKPDEIIHEVEVQQSTVDLVLKLRKDRVAQNIIADTPAKLLAKEMQIWSGTVINADGKAEIIDDSKLQYIIQQWGGQKVAIFYLYQAEGDLLRRAFPNHTDDPAKFQSSEDIVFIGQVRASREGINLSSADDLIFYNIGHSYLNYAQSIERLSTRHKAKQNRVHWVFSSQGIEKEIYRTVIGKSDFTSHHYQRWASAHLANVPQ